MLEEGLEQTVSRVLFSGSVGIIGQGIFRRTELVGLATIVECSRLELGIREGVKQEESALDCQEGHRNAG